MRLFTLLAWLLLLIVPIHAQDDTTGEAPYLYYYSNVLKGIVIERADGTDSRVLGRELVDEDVLWTRGPGWSADGTWFAWHVETAEGGALRRAIAKGYAVRIDGHTLSLLSEFPCVHQMYWHPTDNILLVYGTVVQNNTCIGNTFPPVDTYWLIDADNQELLAMFSFGPTGDTNWQPLMYWREADETVQFRVASYTYADNQYVSYLYLVTMHIDGRVLMEPISFEEARAELGELPPDSSGLPNRGRSHFTHWWEHPHKRVDGVPPAIFYAGPPVAGQRDESHEWMLIGHEYCVAGCGQVVGSVSVFNPATESNREISDCGGHPSCVGWLPERVDVDAFAQGRAPSVLPAPLSIEYSDDPVYSRPLGDVITHEITYNQQSWRRESVINLGTDEIDFVLPNATSCEYPQPGETYESELVVFALSSDNAYFAVTNDTRYTSLYDATTSDRIATLNFYGVQLSFSDDSRYLVTASGSVTATWDIQELIANHAD